MNKYLKDLCTPATVYLALSAISFVVMFIQNLQDPNVYCLGSKKCPVSNKMGIFVGKVLYIALNTWLLNYLCSAGHTNIAWFLLFFPWIFMFVIILSIMSFF